MPIDYRIDAREHLVVTTIYGRVDEAQVRAHAAKAARDPNVQRCDRALVDIAADVEALIESKVISELSLPNADVPSPRRVAVVAPSDMSYGLARVFQGYRESAGDGVVQVFRTRAEAERWLGIAERESR